NVGNKKNKRLGCDDKASEHLDSTVVLNFVKIKDNLLANKNYYILIGVVIVFLVTLVNYIINLPFFKEATLLKKILTMCATYTIFGFLADCFDEWRKFRRFIKMSKNNDDSIAEEMKTIKIFKPK